jgi:hypothetical protein
LFMTWEGCGWKQAQNFLYTTTVFIQREWGKRDPSWDSQYVAKIQTRHASHMTIKCENPLSTSHSETSLRVSTDIGENGKYEKMKRSIHYSKANYKPLTD